MAAEVSPRAVDKRARPGNETTPAPTGPPLTTADFEASEPAESEAAATELTDGAKG
ncbi:hypothetical protein GCM10009554_23180 [Kribbella koreensis]|uniref:Uncharacterized protein n=2 Tax=Kribbella TaxID=182639 RepID=A0ABP6XMT2_9ACTN